MVQCVEITHTAKARTSTQNTSKDAVLRKDVPFGVAKISIYTPYLPKTAILGPDLDGI